MKDREEVWSFVEEMAKQKSAGSEALAVAQIELLLDIRGELIELNSKLGLFGGK